ncbi:MAG: dihydropteroate synthase [Actinobacteria bacterium]|nr:dihydropteroate synthase [Actinomycetota bacterium]
MTLLMGVLNVTPDSFYDGGRWYDPGAAVERGLEMEREGADVIDVGGESTRPGASPVVEPEELRRVVPVVRALAGMLQARTRLSVDTRSALVAEAAIEAGATIINDVSASLWPVAANRGVGWVAMHMKGEPSDMMSRAQYGDVVGEVGSYLAQRAERAAAGGVKEIWVDPGIGFAKTTAHNLALLGRLNELVAAGWPVAVGVSRKRFTGAVAGGSEGVPVPAEDRLEASLAGAVWATACGASMVRVHDVKPTADAIRLVTNAFRAAGRAQLRPWAQKGPWAQKEQLR